MLVELMALKTIACDADATADRRKKCLSRLSEELDEDRVKADYPKLLKLVRKWLKELPGDRSSSQDAWVDVCSFWVMAVRTSLPFDQVVRNPGPFSQLVKRALAL